MNRVYPTVAHGECSHLQAGNPAFGAPQEQRLSLHQVKLHDIVEELSSLRFSEAEIRPGSTIWRVRRRPRGSGGRTADNHQVKCGGTIFQQ